MKKKDQEIEVKFFLKNIKKLEQNLPAIGAELLHPRVHEINLRFDSRDGELNRTRQVLRLRQDREAHVTYKDEGNFAGGVRSRMEIEFTVSDFDATQRLFEALGYKILLMYEKYRTEYRKGDIVYSLDEMPYGDFIEIEGPDPETIQQASDILGLDWNRRILDSYTVLFDLVHISRHLDFRDLSFANFKSLHVPASAMGIKPADVRN